MASYNIPNTLRASSSGFAWGDIIYTTYKSACLRKILVQSRGYDAAINPKYTLVGALNEERHASALTGKTIRFRREVAFEDDLVHGIRIMGHCDFALLDDEGVVDCVEELKSVTSKNTYRTVIKNGVYLVENLAQLISYMIAMRCPDGRLIYTYWEQVDADGDELDPANWTASEERRFEVHIDDFGRINVDGEPTRYTVQDQIAHRVQAAVAIATGKVPQRPHNWDAPFASPCAYCPFAAACTKWDSGEIESDEAFVKMAIQGENHD